MGFIAVGTMCICWSAVHIWTLTITPVGEGQTSYMAGASKNSTGHQLILYAEPPHAGDEIGILSIPDLNQNWPIFEGTDDAELSKGVGHFIQSVLPGSNDNCVLSGHRDTVFSQIGKLKLNDKLIVKTSAGTFTYEINEIRIVDKDDKTVIVPTDHAVLTVTTCYPFIFVGNAPKRYVLIANLVRNE
jgi:sortase A